jgi:hypothetical protein
MCLQSVQPLVVVPWLTGVGPGGVPRQALCGGTLSSSSSDSMVSLSLSPCSPERDAAAPVLLVPASSLFPAHQLIFLHQTPAQQLPLVGFVHGQLLHSTFSPLYS